MQVFYVAFSRPTANHPWKYAAHSVRPIKIYGQIIGHGTDKDVYLQILTDDLASLLPK
jgi:hypothetical protein